MRFSHVVLSLLAVILLLGFTSTAVQAQVPPGVGPVQYWLGPSNNWFFGRGVSSPYASGRIPTPPYFAIHPPVYYSYPVPRPYGYSPFAYPGIVATPEVSQPSTPASAEVINPYVKPRADATAQKSQDQTARTTGQTIINPYFAHPERKAGVELATLGQRNQ